MVMAAPGSVRQRKAFRADFVFEGTAFGDGGLEADQRTGEADLHVHGVSISAEWFLPDEVSRLQAGESTSVFIDLRDPVALEDGLAVMLRRGGTTIASGTVVEALF